ncbi:putative S-adenosylmethionine-dependent methyltransferase At5g37990 [Morella rubra]|uniref:Putative S-adenosylmethionine-dependent methyltransferase At5g37990 n=1 Tax=Morella rubra TaxID=262757 RepID=A0A6A1VHB5_9ROSI|nr:putative S-adenosylmethionine-dependent methyltransferase At5g37990 [Morella rubra]
MFFNDQASNNFNTLFNVLPEGQYFAVGVPGSFHSRLFLESSLHNVHSSYALYWLSTLLEELYDKNPPACNKGRVHSTSAPNEVAKDVDTFLNARAKELMSGGLMVMILTSISEGTPYSQIPTGIAYDMIASILLDMAIEEDQVDSFNLPFYAASHEMMAGLVERNGDFSIERLELMNPSELLEGPVDI